MLPWIVIAALATASSPAPAAIGGSAQSDAPLRVFLRGGAKTHGPGEHDHPRFVEDYAGLLRERGAEVEGGLEFPTADQLARADVLVIYAAEGASIHGEQREELDRFLARGAGLVVLHDGVCGDDPKWFTEVAGGAWEHGRSKWHEGVIDVYPTAVDHPITRGAASFRFDDEIYWDLHVSHRANVLMNGFHTVFDVTPQMWTFEPGPEKGAYRAFVSIQGHRHESFSHPAWRTLLLRGIAWAAKRDPELLLRPGEAEALRYPTGGPTAPEKAHEGIEVHPDFELSLVAAEPLVVKPIAVDWDARGRLWVAMTPGYPEKERFSGVPARDEIAILLDRDGDGRCDERKTFFRGLDLVTGFAFHRDGVLVASAPDILWLRDTDGDDVCDERVVLYTGFGFGDTHAVLSNFREGPDGWIHATQGYSGGASRITDPQGRDFGRIGNGLLRFWPDGGAIEMVSSYGSNTWGCSFDEEGELFFTMANGDHLRHVVMPERFLAGNRADKAESWADCPDHDRVEPAIVHEDAPYAQIDFVGGFTAASGSVVYDGGAWPQVWRGSHFVCEPTVHVVHHDRLEPSGVTFVARKAREGEFVAGRDLWFRPVDVRVGPDGALYLLDFYNQAIVHNDTRGPEHGPTNAAKRPDRDHQHGRIWRIQHRAATPAPVAYPIGSDPRSAVAALAHPNAWVRRTAARKLVEGPGKQALPELRALLASDAPAYAKIAAAWVARRAGENPGVLPAWLADHEARPELARAAARIAMEAPFLVKGAEWTSALVACASSPDRRLALLALCALADSAEAQAALASADIARLPAPADPWTRSALVRWLSRDFVAYARRLEGSACGSETVALARAAAVAAARNAGRTRWDRMLAEIAELRLAPELRVALIQAFADTATTPHGPLDPEHVETVRKLLSDPDLQVAVASLRFVRAGSMEREVAPRLASLAGKLQVAIAEHAKAVAERARLVEALLQIADQRSAAIAAAAALLLEDSRAESQLAVLAALERTDDPAAADAVAAAYSRLEPSARDRAFELLASRAPWCGPLLDRIESSELPASELGPQKLHRLRNHPDEAVGRRANALLEKLSGASSAEIDALIARLLPEVDGPGDRARGKALFEQNCATCHTAYGSGGDVGPDLSGMGAHGARDLLPILLDPNRTVDDAYTEWIVTTVDERNFAGVLARNAEDGVVLRSSSGEVEIAREDIAGMRDTRRSPMPAGFETLGADGLRDLIAYLEGEFAGFRVLDLRKVATSSSIAGLYDTVRDAQPMRMRKYGVVSLEQASLRGIPFELLDPARTSSGCNAVVLAGGPRGWQSREQKPRRVEVPVGARVKRVHVLGGIAAWGHPAVKEVKPILRWTWRYADGRSEPVELRNGVEIADWIRRHDVPGSEFVEGLLTEDSTGQVRYHSLAPSRDVEVASIELESYLNELAPTIVALTAELASREPPTRLETLIVGGGSSHDFSRWFDAADRKTFSAAGIAARYTEALDDAAKSLETLGSVVLCTNQPPPQAWRDALFEYLGNGGGLLVAHASTWRNAPDWPEYNAMVVGGGAESHEALAEFEVTVVAPDHPAMTGIPATFKIVDELYRYERRTYETPITVLAVGRSLSTGAKYPVAWTVQRSKGRTLCTTLGHDGGAHEHPAFQALLTGATRWILGR